MIETLQKKIIFLVKQGTDHFFVLSVIDAAYGKTKNKNLLEEWSVANLINNLHW